jgi:transposase-like protein
MALLQKLLFVLNCLRRAGFGAGMSEFKWRHFEGAVILWAVRWYLQTLADHIWSAPNAPVPARLTVLRESLRSRAIALIDSR